MYRSCFLLGDGISDAIDKSESQGYVDGPGDFGSVGKVEGREVGYQGSNRLFRDAGG